MLWGHGHEAAVRVRGRAGVSRVLWEEGEGYPDRTPAVGLNGPQTRLKGKESHENGTGRLSTETSQQISALVDGQTGGPESVPGSWPCLEEGNFWGFCRPHLGHAPHRLPLEPRCARQQLKAQDCTEQENWV